MGEQTPISWCDHTFNTHEGCEKISPGCKHCYAAEMNKWLRKGENWEPGGPRRFFGDSHWANPLRWNEAAKRDGVRRRVFCASIGDVFEDRRDLDDVRERLWHLIDATPHLDWLLLTKRPENAAVMIPWLDDVDYGDDSCPPNVWLGATMEDDEWARRRYPELMRMRDYFAKLFISYEPALGRIDWRPLLFGHHDAPDLIIFGDESGRKRRPAELDWARETRDVCAERGIAFHFKQWCGAEAAGVEGERNKKRVIHLPILDGVQHAEMPNG